MVVSLPFVHNQSEVENTMRIHKFIIFLLFSFSLSPCFSQEKKWSLEVNYPIPVDNNFVGHNFLGLFDVGAKYRFIDTELLNFGAGLNAGIMKFQNEEEFEYRSEEHTSELQSRPHLVCRLLLEKKKKKKKNVMAREKKQ